MMEVSTKQHDYQDMVAQLPGYDLNTLATACSDQVKEYRENAHSLVKLFTNVERLEWDNARIGRGISAKTDT